MSIILLALSSFYPWSIRSRHPSCILISLLMRGWSSKLTTSRKATGSCATCSPAGLNPSTLKNTASCPFSKKFIVYLRHNHQCQPKRKCLKYLLFGLNFLFLGLKKKVSTSFPTRSMANLTRWQAVCPVALQMLSSLTLPSVNRGYVRNSKRRSTNKTNKSVRYSWLKLSRA